MLCFFGHEICSLSDMEGLELFLFLQAKFVFYVCVSIVFWFLLTCTYCVFYLNKGW